MKETPKLVTRSIVALRLMSRGLAGLSLLAGVVACGGTQGAPQAGSEKAAATVSDAAAPDPDARTAVVLPAMGRDLVLTEMRIMLTSVQGFVAAAALGDTAGMRTAATASGMAAARDLDPAMQQRLPAEFVSLGMTTHAAWDSLAMDVARGTETKQALSRLGVIMSNCVSCHEKFRINLAP